MDLGILNDFKIPALSDDGMLQTLIIDRELLKAGKQQPKVYLSSLLKFNGDKTPIDGEKTTKEDNNADYNLVIALLKAMKEDIDKYGIDEFSSIIIQQTRANYYTKENIYKALNYPRDMIMKHIENKTTHVLPIIIREICDRRKITGEQWFEYALPYIRQTDTPDKPIDSVEENIFRLHVYNPLWAKSDYKFYEVINRMLIEKRIPFSVKYNYHTKGHKDRTIFYFRTKYIKEVVEVFDEIEKLYPEIIKDFGTPPHFCGIKSYYGICHGGLENGSNTYNQFIDRVNTMAFLLYWCNQCVYNSNGLIHKIPKEDRDVIMKLARGFDNKELVQEMINAHNPLHFCSPYNKLMLKYKDQFEVKISIEHFRDLFIKTASLYKNGDLTTGYQMPIAFSKEMINAAKEDKTKTLS